ncbi:hypothetical protein DEU56DRAFT_920002 [Suillus clintonianus]|uniref:uncharacterized protein n=1 Tax=Suillus clintonianus TaxID=1904413 RepID=UPI001B87624E|nr:uncharacterized protein DEU56DRAFT_920002 [Suillus clintonianus]KAG2111471.1 hypothetical protein DEU56DRAFT_920002 [Suillus clintonianus]
MQDQEPSRQQGDHASSTAERFWALHCMGLLLLSQLLTSCEVVGVGVYGTSEDQQEMNLDAPLQLCHSEMGRERVETACSVIGVAHQISMLLMHDTSLALVMLQTPGKLAVRASLTPASRSNTHSEQDIQTAIPPPQMIQAAPTTNATITTTEYFEAPSFTNRTLWNIISSSVLTIFACTYSSIHPNIPSPKDSPFCILRRRLVIMIVALIAPELVVVWAMRQWLSARKVTKDYKESGYFNAARPQKQSENHELAEVPAEQLEGELDILSYILNMLPHGSPASEDHDSARLLVAPAEVSTSRYGGTHALAKPFKQLFPAYFSDQSEDYAWTQTHSFFVLMGGFMLYVDGEPCRTLLPDGVLKLIGEGCIDAPTLTARQISDRSKGNLISKGLIILQVAWFILQLITRAIYHLETTQLETGTLAFAVLNFLTYAVWWNKPLDVQCPYPVYWKSTESKPEDHIDGVNHEDHVIIAILKAIFGPFLELMSLYVPIRKLRVPTFDGSIKLETSDPSILILVFSGMLIATIFGGIHCMAWSFAFPTNQEQVLWRISAVAITCTPWIEVILPAITKVVGLGNIMYMVAAHMFGLLYIVSRGILLVLMFTTLRNLPLDAYKTVSWTSFVPHL